MNNTSSTNNTKKMVYTSILTALLIVFSLMSELPFFSMVSLAVAPIIVALIYVKGGKTNAVIAFVITAILLSMFTFPIYGLTLTILNFCIGFGLIFMIEKNVSPLINLLVLAVSVAIGAVIMAYVNITILTNTNLVGFLEMLVDTMKTSMAEAIKVYEGMGIDVAELKNNNPFATMTVQNLLVAMPTGLAWYAIISATFIYKVSEAVFKRIGIHVEPFPKFIQIKSNMVLVVVTLALSMVGIMGMKLNIAGAEGIMQLGNNLFIVVGGIGGVSLISFLMKTKLKYPAFFRIVMMFFILTSSLFYIVVIAGVLDSAFDFRTLSENGLYQILKSRTKNTK
ncbi:MAG: DUF2232 domain-containing protein [Clostridiaceae bacterium]